MQTVTGHIATIAAAFDLPESDPKVQAIGEGYDEAPKREKFSGGVEHVQYLDSGFALVFEGGLLYAVFVYALDDEGFSPFADTTGLIDGIDLASSTRDDVRGVFGTPYKEQATYDLFRFLGDRVANISFDEGHIWMLTLMARDVRER